MVRLVAIADVLPVDEVLRTEADTEGIGNVSRLIAEWQSGAQRFDRPGEALLAALDGEVLVGIGGVTAEPDADLRAMRMRRLYVHPRWRGRGVGRAMAQELIVRGFKVADLLTVNAGPPGSAKFWEAQGFKRVRGPNRSHELARDVTAPQ